MHMILVRHGETDWNQENRFQGQHDPPLNDTGRIQCRALSEYVRARELHAAYSSDLQRAAETATIILQDCGDSLQVDSRLRERNFGLWEGNTRQEVQERFPESWNLWMTCFESHRPEEGESLSDLHGRLKGFLNEVLSAHPHETVLVVGHGGSVKGLLCAALDAPLSAHRSFRIGNASISEVEHDGDRWRVRTLNDTCHLRGILR